MRTTIKRNSLGVVLIALLAMIIIGISTIAVSCGNCRHLCLHQEAGEES